MTFHIHAEVSEELRARFKDACYRNNKSVMAALKEMIEEYVLKQESIRKEIEVPTFI